MPATSSSAGPQATRVGWSLETEEGRVEGEEWPLAGKCNAVSITAALDAVPLSAFMARHFGRMLASWVVFAMSQEVTAYTFPGLAQEFHASEAQLSQFAAAFPLGCMLGSVAASSAADLWGRRPTCAFGSAAAGLLHLLMTRAWSLQVLILLRVLQAVCWALVNISVLAWFVEFLPTKRRGQFMASYCLGWPIGRGLVIGVAGLWGVEWRAPLFLGAAGFAVFALLMATAWESPRFALASGDPEGAHRVLSAMYAAGGGKWDPETRLCMSSDGESPEPSSSSSSSRLLALVQGHTAFLAFSLATFMVLAGTTVLIDTWGPTIFKMMTSPGSEELPTYVLMMFNLGDLAGILASIALADQLGRRGSFFVGFFLQGALFATMAILSSAARGAAFWITAFGTLASGCRCFAWEAAGMWTIEAFPTDLRATAMSVTSTAMRLFSVVALRVSGDYIAEFRPESSLFFFSGLLMSGGVLVAFFFPMETAGVPMAEGHGRRHHK